MQLKIKANGINCNPEISNQFSDLGNIYYDQGKFELAQENYLKAIQIIKSTFGEDHPNMATDLCNIGLVY